VGVFLYLEASQPSGKTYRFGLRCNLHLAWMVALLTRLFCCSKGKALWRQGAFSFGCLFLLAITVPLLDRVKEQRLRKSRLTQGKRGSLRKQMPFSIGFRPYRIRVLDAMRRDRRSSD